MNGIWAIPVITSILLLLVGTLDDASANGDWNSAGTWTDGVGDPGVPGVADDKFVNHIITISSPVTNSGLIQIGGSGTLTISSTFTNNGFFDGFITNGLENSGGTVTVTSTGIFENNGLYNNLFTGTTTIDVGGDFNNNYALGNAHFHNEATVTVKGEFMNYGDIHQLQNGVFVIKDTAVVNNGALHNIGSNAVFDNRLGARTINLN